MNAGHTPGPWRTAGGDAILSGRDSDLMVIGSIERPADAALAAAAPELLKALERADQFITNGIESGFIRMPDADVPDSAHDTPGIVRTAIAKARGEA